MNIDQLRYLQEISHSRSMTQASENLHISHQALSASINALERELNTTLVEKTHRGSKLTLKGKQLVEISNDFLVAFDQIFLRKDSVSKKALPFKIASNYLAVTHFLSKNLNNIISLPFNYTPTYLEYSCSDDIIDAVINEIADIGFCTVFLYPGQNWQDLFIKNKTPDPKLIYQEVATLNIYCEVSQSHPLAYLESIPLNKLEKYPLVFFFPRLSFQEVKNFFADENDGSNFLFIKYFQRFDFSLESNPSFYYQSLSKEDAIGISIAENTDSIYSFSRIPLQSGHHFKVISVKKRKN